MKRLRNNGTHFTALRHASETNEGGVTTVLLNKNNNGNAVLPVAINKHNTGYAAVPVAIPNKPNLFGSVDYNADGISTPAHKSWHSRCYLPHFDAGNIFQFITFRLHDSVPAKTIEQWKKELYWT